MRSSSAAEPSPRRFLMGSSSLLLLPSWSSIASNATTFASISVLPPPLSSRSSSNLILNIQQLEHQEVAAVDLVRKRPAPDLYLPPPPWHVTGDFSAATGGSAVLPMMLSLLVAWNSKQRRRQSDQDLRTFPLQCAESVSSDDLEEAAQSALQEISKLATPFRTSSHTVAVYFAKAMSAHLVKSYPAASHVVDSRIAAAFKAKQAIEEPFELQDLGHILHLQIMIMQGLQWPGPPSVRLTGLGASMDALDATGRGKQPWDFIDVLVLPFEFCQMVYKPGNLDPEKLGAGTRRREAVPVNWFFPHLLYDIMISKTPCLIERCKINVQREMENEMKWALLKQDGGEEEISQRNPGLKSTLLGFIKYSNTYNPGCIHERHKKKIIFDLNDKGECELPEVRLGKEHMENHKKEKAKASLFTALKVTGIRNHSRYFLLLVLFCTLITAVDSSSRSGGSPQGFCPKPDVIVFLFPRHETVCPVLDISSVHWTHSKRVAPQESQQRENVCGTLVLIASIFCCTGPWMSIANLVPVEGRKVHKFLFFIKIEPVKMWYLTLAMSVNYYVSMITYGAMVKSDQSCGIWVPNAVYCFIFVVFTGILWRREKMTFQVNNAVSVRTCLCCFGGAAIIGLINFMCVVVRPKKFEDTFYFEKIAFSFLMVMHLFRVFTMENTIYNAIVNMVAASIGMFFLCTDEISKWHGYIVILSSVGRILECVTWAIWWMLGRNPLIVIEPVNP